MDRVLRLHAPPAPREGPGVAIQRVVVIALILLAPQAWAQPVDVNVDDVATIAALPGLGPDKAAAIVTWREQHGPFAAVDDLTRVPGVGRATVHALDGQLRVGGTQPEQRQPQPVDINRATAIELGALPGIDAGLAERIVADRTRSGDYGSCSDLARVDGVGPATLAVVGPNCTTGR